MNDKLSLAEMQALANEGADELRSKLLATIPQKGICQDCGLLPKQPGRHKCEWCALNKLSPDEQIAQALARRSQADPASPRTRPVTEWPPGTRWCGGCRSFVGLGYTRGSKCRGCALVGSRQSTWKLTEDQQAALLKLAGGKCMGCLRSQNFKSLAVEHRHEDNVIRGLMEQECNRTIGDFHDDSMRFLRIAVYLIAPPADKILRPDAALSDKEIGMKVFEMLREILKERNGE